MDYRPRPIDTDSVTLPEELMSLVERLAQSNHDVWALGRRQQGWQYGSERNDALKTHPGLVHYAALSEDEKSFDRNTVLETLKAVIALGYRIVPPTE